MPDPFRLTVMKAVSNQLKTITVENGYLHEMSDFTDSAGRTGRERVFRGRTEYGPSDPLPMLAVLEDARPSETSEGGANSPMSMNKFHIAIMGFVKDDPVHPLDPTYLLSAEVVKAIVAAKRERYDIFGLGNRAPCVMDLRVGQPIHRPPDDDVSAVAYFMVPVTLTLAENLEAPFPDP